MNMGSTTGYKFQSKVKMITVPDRIRPGMMLGANIITEIIKML